jgi:outer membrane protein
MHKIVFALFTFFTGFYVNAQTISITYNDAVKMALEQSLLIKREENQLDIFRADKLEASGRYVPSVGLNGNADQTSGRQFDLTSGQLVTQTSQRLSMGVNASLVLFDGFNRINSIKQAQYNFQAQQNNSERIKQQVVFLTTQQFLQVLLDEELKKIAAQNLNEQKILLERLKEFSDVGIVPITDYYNQNAEVKRIEMVLLQAQNQVLVDKAILAQNLQLDPTLDFTLQEPTWMEEQLQVESINLNSLYELAIANRKDYKQQNLLSTSEDLNLKIERGQLLPTLVAYYSYGTGFSSVYRRMDPETEVFDVVPLGEQLFSENLFSSFGVQLRVPILNNFSTRARISRAKNLSENQQLLSEDLRRTIFNEVQGAFLDFNAMTEQYEAAKSTISAAELAFNAQKERFTVGVGTLLEYNAANTAYIVGQSEMVQAQYSLAFQKSILDYFTGTLYLENFLH